MNQILVKAIQRAPGGPEGSRFQSLGEVQLRSDHRWPALLHRHGLQEYVGSW